MTTTTHPDTDALDYVTKLQGYDAEVAALRHQLGAVTKDLLTALSDMYAARTRLESLKLQRQTVRDHMRAVDSDRMTALGALKTLPR